MHPRRSLETSRRRGLAAASVVIVLASALAGCSGTLHEQESVAQQAPGAGPETPSTISLEPDDEPQRGGQLVVAVPADVNGWNPNINQWTDGGTMMGPTMLEGLVTISPEGEPEPYLAESWTHNADFTEWTITVRDGVTFHNGQPLDGIAVKRSLDAYFKTGLSSVALLPLYERVDVSGPRSVTVHLRTEWAQYPASLSSAYMLAPAMLDRPDEGTVYPIGTGPFRFGDWQPGKRLKVTKFDRYWRRDSHGRQLPFLDSIEFKPVIADDTRQEGLAAGGIDLILTAAPATATALERSHTVLRDYTTERTMLLLQTDEGPDNAPNPFKNAHARRALAMATDSRDLARYVGEGVQVTTQAYRPTSRWGLPADQTGYPRYDPATAKQEIEAYKRDTGRKELKFVLKTVPEPRLMAVLQRLRDQWQALGISATIEASDQVKHSIVVALGQYHAAYYRGYGFSNPDQNHWFLNRDNVHPVGQLSLNFTHYQSPTLQKYLETQRENLDFGVRKAAVNAMDRELNDQALQIWLFDTPWAIVAQQRVRGLNGFRTRPFANFDSKPWFGDVWLRI
jgi:peptide/nickel transport system substrate-binding protein